MGAGRREDVVGVCVQTFKLVCGFGGNSARKREAGFQGFRGSHSSGVRKFCFSLHQPICPHICPASQTPLCFLELLCQSVIQSFSLLLPKSRYLCEWLKGYVGWQERGAEKKLGIAEVHSVNMECIQMLLQYSLQRLTSKRRRREKSLSRINLHRFTFALILILFPVYSVRANFIHLKKSRAQVFSEATKHEPIHRMLRPLYHHYLNLCTISFYCWRWASGGKMYVWAT